MSIYYFHCRNCVDLDDSEGTERPSLEAAFDHAKELGGAYRNLMTNGTQSLNVVITDENDDFVGLVPCSFE